MPFSSVNLVAVVAAFASALVLTPFVRVLARRFGLVAKPKIDRWHKQPTAIVGGIAIWLSVTLCYQIFEPRTTYGWVIMLGSTFLFLVGLAADLIHTKPSQK